VTTWSPTTGLATGTTCLVHDALNRLTAVGPALALVLPGNVACKTEADLASVTVRFKYDSRNRRVARQDGTGTWKQWALLPDGSPLTELWRPTSSTGDWVKVREYVWLEGRPLAQVEYPGPTGAEGYVYSVHTDHIGLPRALTSKTGAVVWTATPARPYGDVAEVTTTDPANGRTVTTNLRLPGQYDERLLASIGIQGPYYNWNRWYLPSMCRYMELDPIAVSGGINGPWGPNWYGYAEGNPLRWIDPLGLGPNDWWDPSFYWNTWRDVLGTGSDFWRNYSDMRDANTINADKFFHCMANCEGASRGWAGVQTAEDISETREWVDEHVKGDPRWACDQDRAANAHGRRRQPPGSCQNVCAPLRPPGLPPRY
jgi:RHS repeat-associated protein